MSPGKVVDPYRLDEDLNLGTGYNPPRPATKFTYPKDKGDFAHATLRCVGIGKCRDPQGSPTMCPSYQVTREEKHSTRGRARLLFEMLRGEVITDGWQSAEVADALDLCLACKGCSNDCPVNVDMPTYKAEFRYHHYQNTLTGSRGRRATPSATSTRPPGWPRRSRSSGSTFTTRTPGLRRLGEAGRRHRPAPSPSRFAPMTLREWFQRRGGTANPNGALSCFPRHVQRLPAHRCRRRLRRSDRTAGWRRSSSRPAPVLRPATV